MDLQASQVIAETQRKSVFAQEAFLRVSSVPKAGVKVFVFENVAANAEVNYSMYDSKITGGNITSKTLKLQAGLSMFFWFCRTLCSLALSCQERADVPSVFSGSFPLNLLVYRHE